MGVVTGITLGLMALSAYSQYKGQKKQKEATREAGEAQSRVAESQAQVLDFNAAVADLQAKDAIERGAEAESRFRSQIRMTVGAQRAGLAANNVDVGFGSAVDVQADAAMLGELDALTIRSNAAREAWGYRVNATDIRKRAEITRKEGANALTAANAAANAMNWQMAGSLLGTGASLLQMRYQMGNPTPSTRTTPSINAGAYATGLGN